MDVNLCQYLAWNIEILLLCHALCIGPPLTPQPVFHAVNATHIKVQWDKPFALPEYDVRNYTLLIGNTSSSTHVFQNQILYNASEDTEYPIRHYINNGGIIPDDCVYLNFTLTASSDAGTSNAGLTTGGFAIGMWLAMLCIDVAV